MLYQKSLSSTKTMILNIGKYKAHERYKLKNKMKTHFDALTNINSSKDVLQVQQTYYEDVKFNKRSNHVSKSNSFYCNDNLMNWDDKSSVTKLNTLGKRKRVDLINDKIMRRCVVILKALMTHKDSWVFNEPVDPVKLCIPDYLEIIQNPMDLGTINKKLHDGCYRNPEDFAFDVRLTFSNAMVYNNPNHDVHKMAQALSNLFEKRWNPKPKVNKYVPRKRSPKLPKPNQHDLNKRPMTYNEQVKLTEDLQMLPEQKISQVIQIVSNGEANDDDHEVEIVVEDLDTQTLWELDRLVTNWKKSRNKKPRIGANKSLTITKWKGNKKKICKGNKEDEYVNIIDSDDNTIEFQDSNSNSDSDSDSDSNSDSDLDSDSNSDSGEESANESISQSEKHLLQ